MMKQQITQALRDIAAREVPSDLDLWPGIHAHIVASHPSRAVRPGARRVIAFSLMIVILVLGTAMSVPALNQVLQRFGMVLTPLTPPHVLTQAQDAPAAPVPQAAQPARLSLDEAQKLVPYHIPQPNWLPGGIRLKDVVIQDVPSDGKDTMATIVTIYFDSSDGSTRAAFLDIIQGKSNGGYVFPAAMAQNITIKNHSALYVEGAWNEHGQWQSDRPYGALSWEAGGFTYLLHTVELSRAESIRIAESIR